MSDRQNFLFTGVAANGAFRMPQTDVCSSRIDIDFPDQNMWLSVDFFPTNGTYMIMLRIVILPFIRIFMRKHRKFLCLYIAANRTGAGLFPFF